MQHLAPAMTTLVACSRTCWARDYPVGRCMLGQKDGCGADHDTELQRGAAPDLWQGGLGHNPLQRGAAPDLCQESTGHNPLQYCATSAFSNRRSIPGLPSGTQEYIRTAFRYPGVYPDCLQVPRSIPGLPSSTQEYTRTAFRYPGVYPDCLQVPRSIPTCMLDIWDRKSPIAGSAWVLGIGRASQIRGSLSCMGKGRLPTNAMRGSPSCMGKGQGSLANEGTLYPDCLQVPRSIPGLAPANAHWTWTTATWLFKFLPDPGRNRPGTPDILRKIGSSSRE
jgi:hypothetical protein